MGLINEGNERLAIGINTVEIALAQTILDGGRDKIASVQNAPEVCGKRRNKLEMRKSKIFR